MSRTAGRYSSRLERSGLAGTLQKVTCTGVLRWACQAPVSLLGSQLAALEPLQPDEAGTVVDATRSIPEIVADALARTVPLR